MEIYLILALDLSRTKMKCSFLIPLVVANERGTAQTNTMKPLEGSLR